MGLGGAAGSVISQGKVEQILASKPEERRARGGGGRPREVQAPPSPGGAEARARGQDVARARDIEAEVKKRLRPLALQASAAQRAEKLGGEIASLEAAVATLDLAGIDERIGEASERRAAADHAKRRTESKLEALLAERHRAEEELADAAGKREAATAALYRLKSAGERLELRRESAAGLVESLRQSASRPRLPTGPSAAELRRRKLREEAGLARERLAALERTLAEREGVPPAARARRGGPRAASPSWRWLLETSAPSSQPSRPRRRRGRARRADRAPARRRGSGRRPREPQRRRRRDRTGVRRRRARRAPAAVDLPSPRRGRLRPGDAGAVVPRRGRAEAVLLELEARRRAVAAEVEELEQQAEAVVDELRRGTTLDDGRYRLHIAAAERLERTLSAADRQATGGSRRFARAPTRAPPGPPSSPTNCVGWAARRPRFAARQARPQPLPARSTSSSPGSRPSGRRLSGDSRPRARSRQRVTTARRSPRGSSAWDVDARSSGGSIRSPPRSTSARRNPRGADRAARGSRAQPRRARQAEGRPRPHRRAPLYRNVRRCHRAFRRGRVDALPGRPRPAQADRREPRRRRGGGSGIEVELRPAGKRVTRLSLLSGGEKALGAISFLFALFLARPCPFYLLDEVEAALDDANIGRFVELLRRFSTAPVHRHHPPEEDDGGGGRALRRHDGRRRRLADRVAPPAA